MKKRVFFLLLAALMMPFAMKAQVKARVHVDVTTQACVSYTWSVTGETYTTTDVYTHVSGDTLYILDLTINPAYTINIPSTIQGGCTYSWGDSVYTEGGTHTQTFHSVAGCDSTVTIHLSLATSAEKTYEITACEKYQWKGTTYNTSGIYNYEDNSNSQCDSILTLDLTILTPEQRIYDTTIVACERARYRFRPQASWITVTEDGTTITTERNGYDTTAAVRNAFHPRTVAKCFDSTAVIHFNIRQKGIERHTHNVCDEFSVTVFGEEHHYIYTMTDTITGSGEAASGCDSLYILNLTINTSPHASITGDLRVTPGSNAVLYAHSNQQPASYKWQDNSTGESLTLTNVMTNTDVSLTVTNTSTGCSHTAYATVMANEAIGDVDNAELTVYPNPTTAVVNIDATVGVKNVTVFNLMGQQVMNEKAATSIDMRGLDNGSYILRVELENGAVTTRTVVLSK